MQAIIFDLDVDILEKLYPAHARENAEGDIRRHLEKAGFTRVQDHLYFANAGMDGVQAILAVQEMCMALDWFQASARNLRMLRIEEVNDLMPVIESCRRWTEARPATAREPERQREILPLPPGQRLINNEVLMRDTWRIAQDAKAIHNALHELESTGEPRRTILESARKHAKRIQERARNLQQPRHPEDGAVSIVEAPQGGEDMQHSA